MLADAFEGKQLPGGLCQPGEGADVGQRHPATNNQKLLDLADEAFLLRDDDQVRRRVKSLSLTG